MRTSKSKSFSYKEKNASQSNLFSSKHGIQPGEEGIGLSVATLNEILNKLFLIIQKLFVAIKYQIFKRTQFALRPASLPWFKIIIIALAVFIAFKKDLSFSVNMKSPIAQLGDEEEEDYNFSTGVISQPISLEERKTAPWAEASTDDAKARRYKSYIRQFQKIAIAEKAKFGIPASIKMAQALVESNAGQSRLSKESNNHFGIKCFSKKCRKGHCANFSDDHHKDFFRKYEKAWDSWRAHSEMIVAGRYKELLNHGNDYRAWAVGLKKLGYATDKNYTNKLIEIIETYQLNLLDAM